MSRTLDVATSVGATLAALAAAGVHRLPVLGLLRLTSAGAAGAELNPRRTEPA